MQNYLCFGCCLRELGGVLRDDRVEAQLSLGTVTGDCCLSLMNWKSRLFWLGLLAMWLLCSGVTFAAAAAPVASVAAVAPVALTEPALPASALPASALADRITTYPNWQGKPPIQPVRGDEDLFYPDWFQGNWQVVTTLVEMTAPLAPAVTTPGFEGNRQFLDQPIQFDVRFVEQAARRVAGRADRQAKLISDRAYNGAQLAKAYLGERGLLAVKLDPKNPNRQITLLKGDRQLVSTVTARATEMPDPNYLLTSEFFQQEFRGGPQIYFNEVENTTAYRHQPEISPAQPPIIADQIIADQITAIYLSPQDANYFKTLSGPLSTPRPVALYRYRMEFHRPGEAAVSHRPTPSSPS